MKRTASTERRLTDLAARFRQSARTTGEAERQRIFQILADRYDAMARDATMAADKSQPRVNPD
jgi:hypothetical protein